MNSLFSYLEQTSLAVAISQSAWLFPVIESTHVMGLALVFGSIALMDLRLLGVMSAKRDVAELAGEILPWTWGAFFIAASTGGLLFASAATRYVQLWPFQLKMALLCIAGINMAAFHSYAYRDVSVWGKNAMPPLGARVAGGLSLLLWTGIISTGRIIGFL